MSTIPCTEVLAILKAQPRPDTWGKDEVRRWLEAIELDVYAPTFEAAGVRGANLIAMDADALKRQLGVAHLGHRARLLKEIAVLATRSMPGNSRRGEEAKTRDFAMKRKDLLDSLYPDRVRRELKQQQDEKLLEARAAFWKPEYRKMKGAVDNRPRTGRQIDDHLIITETSAMIDAHPGDHQQRFAHPAQQRAQARAPNNVRKRPQRVRPQTTGAGRGREMPAAGLQNDDDELDDDGPEDPQEAPDARIEKRIESLTERIKVLEDTGKYEELIKAWVEYGACVRMRYSDTDRLLVRCHFSLATTYLRQKLALQALYHFKEAEMVNKKTENRAGEDAGAFDARILEGMGICETRLGHLKAADGLLEQAWHLCVRKALLAKEKMSEEQLSVRMMEVDVEMIDDNDGAIASVLVAKSELHSAQQDYEKAVDCLSEAYALKERVLDPNDRQIGKLFSALGTMRQKQLWHKTQTLEDLQATLESALRIQKEITNKTKGLSLEGLEQEKGLEQLLRDIANMQDKEAKLQAELRMCKADVLDYMNRSRKICEHNNDPETKKIAALITTLASKFAEEEAQRLQQMGQKMPGEEGEDEDLLNASAEERSAHVAQTQAWLAKQGIDANEWGIGVGSTEDTQARSADHDTLRIINLLRATPHEIAPAS